MRAQAWAIRGWGWRVAGVAMLAALAVGTGAASGQSDELPGAGRRWGPHPNGAVWVVNRDQGSLTVFDAATGRVLGRVEAVGLAAHDICVVERVGKAFVTAESANAVTVVDLRTLALDTIPVSPLPHHCEPSADGQTLYVGLASHTPTVGAPQLAAIDTEDYSVTYVTTSGNAAARTHGPHPTLDGDRIYVAHDVGDEVTGVDTETGEIALSVTPIVRAEEVVASRAGDVLWVSSRGDGTVKRIDSETGAITGAVAVGVQPESVILTPSERLLAVSLRGSPANLAFVDTRDLTLDALVPLAPVEACGAVAAAPSFGNLAVMSRDGRFVFATFDRGASCRGGVSVVDVRTRQVVATWPYPGTGRPHGIWYTRRKPNF